MANPQARVFLPLNPSIKLSASLFIAIIAISTASLFIRFAQAEGTPSLVIATVRLTIATLLLSPIAILRHRAELNNLSKQDFALGIAAGLFLAVHFAMWISSLEYTSVASSVVFVSTGPLWVAILSPMLLHERVSRVAVVGLMLAILGGTMIGLADACVWNHGLQCPETDQILQGRALGNFLALCGALAVSGYLIIGRKVRIKMSLIPYIFLVYGFSAIFLNIFMFASRQSPFGYSPSAYGWIFLLAVIPQLIGHSTFNWLLKYLSATMVAVNTLSEPIGSAILAFLFLRETPTPPILIGGAFILFGIYLTSRPGN